MDKYSKRLQAIFHSTKKEQSFQTLRDKLRISPKEADKFYVYLQQQVAQGNLVEQRGKYIPAARLGLLSGEVVKLSENFGFVKPDGNQADIGDIYVAGRNLLGAMPGDKVLVSNIKGRGDSPEGKVYKIVTPAPCRFIATLIAKDGKLYVRPDSGFRFDIQVSKRDVNEARIHDKVLVEIISRGQSHYDHRAAILRVFGDAKSAQVCCQAILAVNNVENEFDVQALAEAREIMGTPMTEEDFAGRLDLRDRIIFTIDGADAKDLDDAVSLTKTETGYELGVHIADVSHYVKHGSALDRQAFMRGTSVYYADKVVPMLPKELSNGICSLNPQEDRLTFSAIMELDCNGKLKGYHFAKSVICSRVKGVYHEVNTILDGSATPKILQKYQGLTDTLFLMQELAVLLEKQRTARGGFHIEKSETRLIIGENGKAVDILPRTRGQAEKLIEEFMLCANEAAATWALVKNIPFIYRTHERPNSERIEILAETLRLLGQKSGRIKDGVSQHDLARVLTAVRGTPLERIISNQVLRTMAKAKYTEYNIGHYGLVLDKYSHFTSPIRRYPDLAIHRILSDLVNNVGVEKIKKRYDKFVAEASHQSSMREIVAMNTERDCEACYMAEYMASHIGEEFIGIVSSVAPHGMYVELENTVEGLIRIESLPGTFAFDGKIALVDSNNAMKFTIGDTVKVLVLGADVPRGQIDFALSKDWLR